MTHITEKNTKAEVLSAYEDLLKKVEELKHKLNSPAPPISQEESSVMAADNSAPMSVVIPYVGRFAQGDELILALRGWSANFRENFNLVVIGNDIPPLHEDVHIISCDVASKNPPLDIAAKMLKAIESEVVSEKFIWANDDQYLISPCMLADFEILKCAGKLDKTKFGSSTFQQNKQRTFQLLQDQEKPVWDYATHIPVVLEKGKLKELIELFNLQEEPHLIASLYFNYFFPDFVPLMVDDETALEHDNFKIGVYRSGANLKRLKELMPGKKLINNSQTGWSNDLSRILNKRFPDKCRFEN